MTTISVCIGSACHKRGSYAILNRFKALAAEKGVSEKVTVASGLFALANVRTALR